MQAPMLVLKNNSKRESGRKVQLSNIKAAKTISDIVSIHLNFSNLHSMDSLIAPSVFACIKV